MSDDSAFQLNEAVKTLAQTKDYQTEHDKVLPAVQLLTRTHAFFNMEQIAALAPVLPKIINRFSGTSMSVVWHLVHSIEEQQKQTHISVDNIVLNKSAYQCTDALLSFFEKKSNIVSIENRRELLTHASTLTTDSALQTRIQRLTDKMNKRPKNINRTLKFYAPDNIVSAPHKHPAYRYPWQAEFDYGRGED